MASHRGFDICCRQNTLFFGHFSILHVTTFQRHNHINQELTLNNNRLLQNVWWFLISRESTSYIFYGFFFHSSLIYFIHIYNADQMWDEWGVFLSGSVNSIIQKESHLIWRSYMWHYKQLPSKCCWYDDSVNIQVIIHAVFLPLSMVASNQLSTMMDTFQYGGSQQQQLGDRAANLADKWENFLVHMSTFHSLSSVSNCWKTIQNTKASFWWGSVQVALLVVNLVPRYRIMFTLISGVGHKNKYEQSMVKTRFDREIGNRNIEH